MSKEYTHIKANGIRNELKDLRRAVDKLTQAIIEIHIAQTTKHDTDYDNAGHSSGNDKLCQCQNE